MSISNIESVELSFLRLISKFQYANLHYTLQPPQALWTQLSIMDEVVSDISITAELCLVRGKADIRADVRMAPNENEFFECTPIKEEAAPLDDNEAVVLYRNQEFLPDNRSMVFLDEEEQQFYPSLVAVQADTQYDSTEAVLSIIAPMSVSNEENVFVAIRVAVSTVDLFPRMACTDLNAELRAPGDAGYTNLVNNNCQGLEYFSGTETVTLYRNNNFADEYSSTEVSINAVRSTSDSEDFTVEIASNCSDYLYQFHHEKGLFSRAWKRFKNLFACVTK